MMDTDRPLTHLSLFSGIGGLDLAAEWAGFKTVGQCEFADYPTRVLEKHWPDVPRWRDIRTLTKESFYERTGRRTVDVISGGFPCQPFSVAGKQRGKEDERYLWPEMFRVIRELRPHCVVGENVPGIIRIAAGQVVKDLEQAGYHAVVFHFEAAAVGAWHRRARVFFVGISDVADADSRPMWNDGKNIQSPDREIDETGHTGLCQERPRPDGCNASGTGLSDGATKTIWESAPLKKSQRPNWWAVEPDVGRVANGIPHRVDRLKCLGNAVVPQQAYPIFRAIADVERSMSDGNK